MIDFLLEIDKKWFLFLNGIHSPFWDTIMWYVSETKTWIPLYAVILFFIFRQLKWKGFITLFFIILLITLSDQISVRFFKNVFERLRPCHNQEIANFVHIVNNKCGGQFGFVSSHASNTFSLAMFTSLLFRNKPFSISIFLWAVVVSYSRIYLGVHFPFDILGGAILGIIIGILVYKTYQLTTKYIKTKSRHSRL
ncbi:MAG: phosphatase PAP2 family protein [Bacteroidales bacterium]|nr:phosphatase PAP2 family protein [Bacteroidales bacterium]